MPSLSCHQAYMYFNEANFVLVTSTKMKYDFRIFTVEWIVTDVWVTSVIHLWGKNITQETSSTSESFRIIAAGNVSQGKCHWNFNWHSVKRIDLFNGIQLTKCAVCTTVLLQIQRLYILIWLFRIKWRKGIDCASFITGFAFLGFEIRGEICVTTWRDRQWLAFCSLKIKLPVPLAEPQLKFGAM